MTDNASPLVRLGAKKKSQFRLFSCSVFCFSLAEFSLREDWRTV